VRSGYRCGPFFLRAISQIYCVAIAAFLSIFEYEPVTADAFFFDQVVDYGIYPVPAELLFRLAGSAITDYRDLTF
jgi:hypothetical protein